MEMILLLLRILLAGIFALAGIAKFLDLKGSEKAFVEFGVPRAIALPSSIALATFEIAIAGLFLVTTTSWFGSVGASFLLILFISQMIYQMAKGNAPNCHCFGQIHSEPVGKVSSDYVIAAPNPEALGSLERNENWVHVERPADIQPWTDDYSNMLKIVRWR